MGILLENDTNCFPNFVSFSLPQLTMNLEASKRRKEKEKWKFEVNGGKITKIRRLTRKMINEIICESSINREKFFNMTTKKKKIGE